MGKSTKASMEGERKRAEACRAGKKVERKEQRLAGEEKGGHQGKEGKVGEEM